MTDIEKVLADSQGKGTALYGLGTETERFISEYGNSANIICLLDGFREEGELYDYPIMSIGKAIDEGVDVIIVVARPGSCKAIAKRIGAKCRENDVALFDVRGKDLLAGSAVKFDFATVNGETMAALFEKIHKADVVSFDLFDTLVMRKVYSYTDIFELVDLELKKRGIVIPDFTRRRLSAEKELSRSYAPTLEKIYSEVLHQIGGCFMSAEELAEIEWGIDLSTMIPRKEVCRTFREVVSDGKKVVITTDSYYNRDRIEKILAEFWIGGYENVLISCDLGTSKTLGLFDILVARYGGKSLLHIGDDEVSDIECATYRGIDTYRIYSGLDLFDSLGGMGTDDYGESISDRTKRGLFISRAFNSPFQFETEERRIGVSDAGDLGYLFCGAMVSDFTLWMKQKVMSENYRQILFCARDGYLLGRLYRKADMQTKSVYFLASRAAAIRAGMESDDDINYVDSMKYFGSPEQALKTRFGLELSNTDENSRRHSILNKAENQKKNYNRYIEKLGIDDGKLAMFDFVAKGTTQMYLERVLDRKMKGFYFLQLEPEFMADKGLDIEPFYSDEEKNPSAIFDNYYILETILTSPYSQTEEFDEDGNPVFATETRCDRDIRCFEKMQKGIIEYFDDYLRLLPDEVRTENKKLDEVFLSMVNKVEIKDDDFLALKVEDPFFGRMTDITDVIG